MHIRLWCTLALVFVNCCPYTVPIQRPLRLRKSKQFLLLRTTIIEQRACTCSTSLSCSCCETVTFVYTKTRKTLCSNFMYQRNGLNVDISLNTDTLRTMTVTAYRPFKLCTTIPGSLFSSICLNVVELNEFPRSLTVCVRHEILSKFQEWQINYTCVSISTELPMVTAPANTSSPSGMAAMASMTPAPAATTAAPMPMMPMMSMMSMMPMMASTAAPMMTMTMPMMMMMMMMPANGTGGGPSGQMGGPSGQMGGMPPAPGEPPGQMGGMPPSPGEPPGQMDGMPPAPGGPPGQMGGMPPAPGEPPGQMGGMPASGGRKKRHTQNSRRLRGRWSGIVNIIDKFGNQPVEFGDSNSGPTATMFRSPSTSISDLTRLVAFSGGALADSTNPVASDITMNYNGRPSGNQGLTIIYEETTNQYPSRIPPVIAMSLKGESDVNREDKLLVMDDNNNNNNNNNNNVVNKNTVDLVFPD